MTRKGKVKQNNTELSQLSTEQQVAAGAGPDVVRVSIGIESVADIIADLERGLGIAARR